MSVAAVIVDHRTPDAAVALAAQLREQRLVAEILIVENGPDPIDPATAAAVGFRSIHVENRGFGAAVNAGVATTSAPVVVIANPDLGLPDAAVLERLASELEDPAVGAVGPTFRRLDGALDDGTSPELPSILDSLRRAARRRSLPPGRHEVRNLTGALLVMRRTTWDEVGGFDESFFLYFEDADLCTRLGRLGYRLVRSEVEVVHATSAAPTPCGARGRWSREAQRRYFRLWRPTWEQRVLPACQRVADWSLHRGQRFPA